jgi:hypothetical protein
VDDVGGRSAGLMRFRENRFVIRTITSSSRLGIVSVIVLSAMLSMLTSGATAATSVDKWTPPILIGSKGSSATQVSYSVSCPASTFCATVNGDGQVLYDRSGVWSTPESLALGGSIDSVSCSSTTFCVAVAAGKAAVFNGHVWSSAVRIGPQGDTYKVSCPNSTFCAAVGANGVAGKPSALMTFNGRSWTVYKTASTGSIHDRLLSVSCSTAQFCMATNFDGQFLSFNGSRWNVSHSSAPKFLISVSCTGPKFCMAVATTGKSMTFHDGSWSAPKLIPAFKSAGAYAVSCASAEECSVIGLNGAVTSWSSGRWSSPSTVFPGGFAAGVAISCSTKSNCVAVNDRGMSSSR